MANTPNKTTAPQPAAPANPPQASSANAANAPLAAANLPPEEDVTIPLTPDLRAAYQNLYTQLQAAVAQTNDPGVFEAMKDSRDEVNDVLTKDDLYAMEANTALYTAMQTSIASTNTNLKALQKEIAAIANGVKTFGAVVSGINQVLTLVGV